MSRPTGAGHPNATGRAPGTTRKTTSFTSLMGVTASGRFDDTWAFDLDAERWTEVSPSDLRPMERCIHRCAFDPGSNSLFLFGGQSNQTPILGDLWSYDPSLKRWTDVSPEGDAPSPRFFSSLVRDLESGSFLVFGGFTGEGRKNDLWSYSQGDGSTGLATSGATPGPRSNHSGVFVRDTGAYYIYGGVGDEELGELWLLKAGWPRLTLLRFSLTPLAPCASIAALGMRTGHERAFIHLSPL